MATLSQQPQPAPSPELFWQTANAYMRSAALKTAVELDAFTAIGEGNADAKSLASRCGASERGMRVLCDVLAVSGFLVKKGETYELTPDSAMFLDRRSPAFLASAVMFMQGPALLGAFQNLTAAVKKGGTVMSEHGSMEPEHPMWEQFARDMAPMMTLPSEAIARILNADAGGKWKVLDIAAGHGIFGIALARHNPQARVVGLDWPKVLQVARENAARAGVADRYETIEGSAFEAEFGGEYDVVLLTNFLHHFDRPTNEALLRKVHAALKPGGAAVTLEMVPNDDRISPPDAAQFALIMLASTERGDAYTFAEYDRMFRNAGFARSEIHPVQPTPESVIVSRK